MKASSTFQYCCSSPFFLNNLFTLPGYTRHIDTFIGNECLYVFPLKSGAIQIRIVKIRKYTGLRKRLHLPNPLKVEKGFIMTRGASSRRKSGKSVRVQDSKILSCVLNK